MDDRINVAKDMLLDHELYSEIKTEADLRIFMEAHVFAVWDFMSLAKRLQRDMTCVDLPWMPPQDNKAAHLINEIIWYEESDVDHENRNASHLEMYLGAMEDVGADTSLFKKFLGALDASEDLERAFEVAEVPEHIRTFVRVNIGVAMSGTTEEVASSFLYGREDAIPDMFTNFLEKWSIDEDDIPRLTYYLKRHIDLDGDEHGPAAHKILERLIGGDAVAQERADRAALDAIRVRVLLWDGVYKDISDKRLVRTVSAGNDNGSDTFSGGESLQNGFSTAGDPAGSSGAREGSVPANKRTVGKGNHIA